MRPAWKQQLMLVLSAGVFLVGTAVAQEGVWQGRNDHPMLRATLKDKDKNAQKHVASVEVETQNIGLVTVGASSYAESDMGLLEYQVDKGPVLATSDTTVMFRDLTPGKHTITVSLVNADYKQLGVRVELEVDIPASASAA